MIGGSFRSDEGDRTLADRITFLNVEVRPQHNVSILTIQARHHVMDGDQERFGAQSSEEAEAFITGMYLCCRYFHEELTP